MPFPLSLRKTIWIVTVMIMLIGLTALYSATYHNTKVDQKIFYDQLVCAVIGLGLMFLLSHFDYRKFYEIAYILYIVDIILLVLVLVVGRYISGARRWIEFGDFNFQPSELAKLVVILALSRYLTHQNPSFFFTMRSSVQVLWRNLIFPFLLIALPVFLIFKQPDLGTAILLFGMFIIMLFVSGIKYRYFFSFTGIVLGVLPFMWHMLKPYQRERLLVFLNPNIDPLGAGYTIIQSKIAIGSGRWFGKGWLSGTQNQLNFLPERHTDFIFSVLGEEWGLFGTLLLTFLYFILIYSCLKIARQTKDKFGLYAASGIVAILTLQVVINIGMVLGLCPVVGLTLPLISYGRSSFLVFVVMIGFLLNLNRQRSVF